MEIDPWRTFIRRELPTQERGTDQIPCEPSHVIEIVLRFHADMRHLAEEWFGIEELLPVDDGSWLEKKAYPEDEWLSIHSRLGPSG